MTSRRRFITLLPLAGAATWAAAQTAAVPLDPKDPQAVALGYTPDATKVDKAKYPAYVAGSACGNCALYQGAANSASGPCPIYAGKLVSSKAWCSAYAKKA
jgi:High potential iron-sulfur protein